MFDKLDDLLIRYEEIMNELSEPGVADNQVSQMMVKDIVRICDSCGMICIAEGVETEEQVREVKEAGCHYAQGYYFDYPLPANQFEEKYLRSETFYRKINE